jgi:hypothetical protein
VEIDTESLRPPDDPVFQHLLEQAVTGQVPVYGIVVDVALLVPFAADHNPQGTAEGRSIVQSMIGAWQEGQRFQPWVYPRAGQFVVSDDYMILAMAKAGGLETIGCQCLGEPDRANVHDCQGPLGVDYVRKALGVG